MAGWTIDIASEGDTIDPRLERLIESAIRTVLRAEAAEDVEVSVALLSDESIRAIHRDYLNDDTPTDVITFPLREAGQPLVGDIYIGLERAAAQAAELGIPLDEEIVRLAIHSALHLLGWDHPEAEGRTNSPMYRRQEELVTEALESNP